MAEEQTGDGPAGSGRCRRLVRSRDDGSHHGPVTTWMRCYWDEEVTWYYFEVDAEGWVTRQVELQGSETAPIAAASLEEWQRAQQAGGLAEYEKKYGVTAELPVSQWEDYEPDQLTSQEFEEVWDAARQEIAAR